VSVCRLSVVCRTKTTASYRYFVQNPLQITKLVSRNIYFAFVYPNILYGLKVYGNTYVSYLDKLTTLNNKILRILQKKGRCCNDCLYMQYDTLPPCQLFNYQVWRFVHTMVYLPHLVPMIFHNYFTLSTSVHNYSTRHTKLYLTHVSSPSGGRLLNFKGSQLWNRLPKYLINIKYKIMVLLMACCTCTVLFLFVFCLLYDSIICGQFIFFTWAASQ